MRLLNFWTFPLRIEHAKHFSDLDMDQEWKKSILANLCSALSSLTDTSERGRPQAAHSAPFVTATKWNSNAVGLRSLTTGNALLRHLAWMNGPRRVSEKRQSARDVAVRIFVASARSLLFVREWKKQPRSKRGSLRGDNMDCWLWCTLFGWNDLFRALSSLGNFC